MYRYAQIQDDKVHYIMEHEADLETLYEKYFNQDHVTFIDITEREDVQEGWNYIGGVFSAPNEESV